MGKKTDRSPTKDTKTVKSVKQKKKSASKLELPKIEEKKSNKITIFLESCQNILQPTNSVPNLTVRCVYKNEEIGDKSFNVSSESTVVIDHKFMVKCDTESPQAQNELVENPVLLKIFQPETLRNSLSNETSNINEILAESLGSQVESALSLYEAFTGDIVKERSLGVVSLPTKPRKKSKLKSINKKEKKSSKGSQSLSKRSSKSSKKSKQSVKTHSKSTSKKSLSKNSSLAKSVTETELGTCVIDLTSLALGKASFSQFIPVTFAQTFIDDRMVRYLTEPGFNITVSIEKPLEFECKPQLLTVTLESIFNIPLIISDLMAYDLCLWVPSAEMSVKPTIFKNGIYTTNAVETQANIGWASLEKGYFNVTTDKLDSQISSIRNYAGKINFGKVFTDNKPRIEFNCLNRNVLTKQDFFHLFDHVRTIQRIVVEIFIYDKILVDTKGVNSSARPTLFKPNSYLHLMAIVDLSTLLYPEATKTRIAVPLRTFHEIEAFELGHLSISYFEPLKEKPSPSIPASKSSPKKAKGSPKKPKKKSKSEKTSSKSSKKSKKSSESKKSKKSQIKTKTNEEELRNLLPEKPPEIEIPPSVEVYNEDGEPTFIILQFELSESLVEKKPIEVIDDYYSQNILHEDLEENSGLMLKTRKSSAYYHNIIENIIKLINKYFASYTEKKLRCHCNLGEIQNDFLTYLKRVGVYQTFIDGFGDVAAAIAQSKLDDISPNKKLNEYQRLIEKIFIKLTTEVNKVLQTVTSSDESSKIYNFSNLLFYAKEARENGFEDLANSYYLTMLYHNPKNAGYWFNYAIFYVENNDNEKALVCLQEALSIQKFHKNSLLLIGIILSEMNRIKDAELHLLTLMVQEPHWIEGWTVLYLFYKNIEHVREMEHALEMAKKCSDCQYDEDDFQKSEDLAWSSTICPNTIYFKTAIMLLKMRIYSWVEKILSHDLKETGIIHYLLAVICYYKKDYEHALTHLERAKYFHGSDHNVMSLKGHCHFGLREFTEAEKEYSYVLSFYEKPERMHLLYINYAKVINDKQKRKKLLLMACKNDPTPYTWMTCGILHFQENDLLSAEECFSNSIDLDNEIADNWGYLTLIHLKLNRINEAEVCYSIALKNNVEGELLKEIKNGFEKLKQR